eukprot:TRINITY_DN2365_c0_g2_i1.p1 TRINITY_DN2365_c0_g2~~TRINITY_DN2365_c0_g2_i1.p1  ORF type:complete len:287 (+),score=102.12 TRINITY_DN2365_c0_g2_i1:36-863(+)
MVSKNQAKKLLQKNIKSIREEYNAKIKRAKTNRNLKRDLTDERDEKIAILEQEFIDKYENTEDIEEEDENEIDSEDPFFTSKENMKKSSRKQKRMEKKEIEEQQRLEEMAKIAAEQGPSKRTIELNKLTPILQRRNLIMTDVPATGSCLFESVSRSAIPCSKDAFDLRVEAVEYISEHWEDFAPFMEMNKDEYVKQMSKISVWGGHPEIMALTHVLKRPIIILQADQPNEMTFGNEYVTDDFLKSPVEIVFLKHFISTGEHYNATGPSSMNYNII